MGNFTKYFQQIITALFTLLIGASMLPLSGQNVAWLSQLAHPSNTESWAAKAIAADHLDNAFTVGHQGNSHNATYDLMLAKQGPHGGRAWQKVYNPSSGDIIANDLAYVLPKNLVAVVGSYNGSAYLGFFDAMNGNNVADYIFPGDGYIQSVKYHAGHIYVVGNFGMSTGLGNGFNFSSAGAYNAFVAKLDLNGNTIDAVHFTSPAGLKGFDLVLDDSGNVYFSAAVKNSVQFFDSNNTLYTNSFSEHILATSLDNNLDVNWAEFVHFTNYVFTPDNLNNRFGLEYPVALTNDQAALVVAGQSIDDQVNGLGSFVNTLSTVNGQAGVSNELTRARIHDIAISECNDLFITGSKSSGNSLRHPNSSAPCGSVFFTGKYNVYTLAQAYLKEEVSGCSYGEGIALDNKNIPISCGYFSCDALMNQFTIDTYHLFINPCSSGIENGAVLKVSEEEGCCKEEVSITKMLEHCEEGAFPHLSVSFSNWTQIRWYQDGILLPAFHNQTQIPANQSGLYQVKVQYDEHCTASDLVSITPQPAAGGNTSSSKVDAPAFTSLAYPAAANDHITVSAMNDGLFVSEYYTNGLLMGQKKYTLSDDQFSAVFSGDKIDDNSGHAFVSHAIKDAESGKNDLAMMRFDEKGNLVWQKKIESTANDSDLNLGNLISSGNDVLAAGTVTNVSAVGATDIFVIKTDLNGNVSTSVFYQFDAYSVSYIRVHEVGPVLGDEKYAVSGILRPYDPLSNARLPFILLLNENGGWEETILIDQSDIGIIQRLVVTSNQNIIAMLNSEPVGEVLFLNLSLTSNNHPQGAVTTAQTNYLYSLRAASGKTTTGFELNIENNDELLIFGNTSGNFGEPNFPFLARLGAAGNVLWSWEYTNTDFNKLLIGSSLERTSNNELLFSGFSIPLSNGTTGIWSAKTDDNGVMANCECSQNLDVVVNSVGMPSLMVEPIPSMAPLQFVSPPLQYTLSETGYSQVFCDYSPEMICEDCPDNIITNPGFNEGSGFPDNWANSGHTPQASNDFCDNEVSMQMWGNQDVGEAIEQGNLNIKQGYTYKISFCARFVPEATLPTPYVRFKFVASNQSTVPFNCTSNCAVMGISQQVTSEEWACYELPAWTADADYSYIQIKAQNDNPDSGTPTNVSWGRIDNICVTPISSCSAEYIWNQTEGCKELEFNATYGGANATYSWNFGGQGTATGQNPTFQFSQMGSYNVCLTVNTGEEECTYCEIIGVGDTVMPTLDCPASIPAFFDGCNNLVPNLTTQVAATDNCNVTLSQSIPPGTIILQDTPVVVTASDGANQVDCTIEVTFSPETVAPEITCPDDQFFSINCGANGGFFPIIPPAATDNCTGTPNIICTPALNSFFPAGTTIVSCYAVDDYGNTSATCTFTVTAEESGNPLDIICPPSQMLPVDANCEAITPDFTADVVINGGCPPYMIMQTPAPGTVVTNPTSIQIKVEDNTGQMAACGLGIELIDNIDPVMECPPDISIRPGDPTSIDYTGEAQATDNCGIQSIDYEDDYEGTEPCPLTIIRTWYAADYFGNTTSCQQIINVECPPMSTCENNSLQNGDFQAGLVAGDLNFNGDVDHWEAIPGSTPQVIDSEGCQEYGSIQLWGNQVVGEGFRQNVSLIAGNSYDITFCGQWLPFVQDSVRVRFRATVGGAGITQNNHLPCNGPDCEEIWLSPVLDVNWNTYTISGWTPAADYDMLVVTLWNNYDIDNGDYVSWARIDDICIGNIVTSAQKEVFQENELTVYPNPTNTGVYLSLEKQIKGPVELHLMTLSGKLLNRQILETQEDTQYIDLSNLPASVYLVLLIDRAGNVWRQKVVKQ
ncbi:MAG: T9SS type A sorting domain-containing protein [Lewinellaceae bacterium]|nr:T9SS type A sorting domain-containing protein [Lewinellaceae bacterium]